MFDRDSLDEFYNILKSTNHFFDQFTRRKVKTSVIWEKSSVRILEYTSNNSNKSLSIICIPSLINKSYILNLTEETSLIRYLNNSGYKVYLVDFLEPSEEQQYCFTDYYHLISEAVDFLTKQQAAITLGYCLGGIFSTALHAAKKPNLLGQILIATAWDLSHLKKIFCLDKQNIVNHCLEVLKYADKISPTIIQWCFTTIDPANIWNKFLHFSQLEDPQAREKFLSVEQWIHDGLSINKRFALEAMQVISKDQEFLIDNQAINLTNCHKPSLCFSGIEDKIAPPISCTVLYQQLPNCSIYHENTGHIGLIISKIAQNNIWPRIKNWTDQLELSISETLYTDRNSHTTTNA